MAKNKTFTKVFQGEVKLEEMLSLLKKGESVSNLSKTFNVHRTSIWYQLKRLGLEAPPRVKKPKTPTKKTATCKACGKPASKHAVMCHKCYRKSGKQRLHFKDINPKKEGHPLTHETINRGKSSYKAYLEAEKQKKLSTLLRKKL